VGSGGSSEPGIECNPVELDACPAGSKCTALQVGGRRDQYRCVDDPGGLAPGESCQPDVLGGVDGCPAGTACVAGDTESAGRCVTLCLEPADCGGGECIPGRVDALPHCAARCDPLADGCPEGFECRRLGDDFVCQLPSVDDVGGEGAPCASTADAGCAARFTCVGSVVPGCPGPTCCAPLCSLAAADVCPLPTACTSLGFSAGDPLLADVGACVVPQ
jgi:hypothetical protein